MTIAFALAATAILLVLAGFQTQLALGRPVGRFAWGGAHEVLPPRLRIASAVSIGLYGAIALVLLDAADVLTRYRAAGPVPLSGCWPRTFWSASR